MMSTFCMYYQIVKLIILIIFTWCQISTSSTYWIKYCCLILHWYSLLKPNYNININSFSFLICEFLTLERSDLLLRFQWCFRAKSPTQMHGFRRSLKIFDDIIILWRLTQSSKRGSSLMSLYYFYLHLVFPVVLFV